MKLTLILDRRYWAFPVALWTVLVLGSFSWNLALMERESVEVSTVRARAVFGILESMRQWNARHGGIYVLESESGAPTGYLDWGPEDLRLADGRRLKFISAARMTHELSAPFSEQNDLEVHLTSLQPLNPKNVADPWERAALTAFDQGEKERVELVDRDGTSVLRYMAPLPTQPECLECHAHQGYRVGDIRGGISVSLPLGPVAVLQHDHYRSVLLGHSVTWLLVLACGLFALSRWRRELRAAGRAREEQEALVLQRTAELRGEVAERRQAETQLRLLVDALGSGVFGLGPDGRCTFVNPEALRMLGADHADRFVGRPILELIAPAESHAARLHDALRHGHRFHSDDLVFWRLDGRRFAVEVHLDPISEGGANGAVVSFDDISNRKAAEAQVWRQANFDPLTGLPNRSHCYASLNDMIVQARRSREIIALLFVDLDGFKSVNDLYGHAAGDLVLRVVAERLQGAIRESDMAARLGGDEFVVVLRHLTSEEYAGSVATKLLDSVVEPIAMGAASVTVGASIGLAFYPRDADSSEALIRCADLAMYEAKEQGKGVYRVYAPEDCEGRSGGA